MGIGPEEKEQAVESGALPAVPPKVRTVAYFVTLIVNVVTVVGFGLASIFGWVDPQQASAAVGVILGGLNIFAAGLALAYRPTRPGVSGV